MRIIVTGGRDYRGYDNYRRVLDVLTEYVDRYPTIIEGGATGADALAQRAALHMRYASETYSADWSGLGKVAGVIRNQKMIDLGADLVIAFPGGRGTADMVRKAHVAGIPVRRII